VLAEKIERLSCFFATLLPIGVALGASTYGYLYGASFAMGVLMQLPLSAAFVAHRIIVRRHSDSAVATLAFPCVHTAMFVLAMYALPIGSTANPAYSVTSLTFVLQAAAFLGRNGVTFLLAWAASCLSRIAVVGFKNPVAKRSLLTCSLVWLLFLLLGALRVFSPHLFVDISNWDGSIAEDSHHVSCLSGIDDMYKQTQVRLAAGDTIVIHSERATPTSDSTISSYAELLGDNYAKNGIDAVAVLSFVVDDKSWYHLVSRKGSLMSYAKNHPVPFVEDDIVGGDSPPSVVSVSLGGSGGPVSVTGTICFDTDFPWLTRGLYGADLYLETSETWYNIGEEHFQGHKLTAIENGATLIKCTHDGVTGAFDAFGNELFRFPQTSGVVTFMVPRFQRMMAVPVGGFVFDVIVLIASIVWLVLCTFPALCGRVVSANGTV